MPASTRQLALSELAKYGLSAELVLDSALPAFEISAKSDVVTITAPDEIELLYGVYDLAERFGGYCFFEPGKDRFDPARKATALPDGVLIPARKPALAVRGFVQEFPFNDETAQLFDWMAKNKLNYLQVWMKYYDELSDDLKEMARLRGIVIESGHHNFNYWIPGRKYNQTHPEFFAEINGKRIESSDGKTELLLSEQLCTTNQGLRDEIVKNMLAYLAEHPELKVIALNPNDGFGWCECPECSKFYDKHEMGDFYSVSEHVYKANRIYHDLIHYVTLKLHEARPDVELTFGAYVNYCSPAPGMELTPGTTVWVANYWRCINHLICDPECPINSGYAKDILNWVNVKRGGKVYIYEYFMGINFYLSLPMIHIRDVFQEVQWYADHQVDGLLTQFHIPHWSVYGVNYYMMAKAARGEKCEDAIPQMMQCLFGYDAQEGTAFYDAVKAFLLKLDNCLVPYPNCLLTRVTQDECQALLTLAENLAAKAPADPFRQDLVAWMQYLCKFKTISQANDEGTLTLEQVDDFQKWIHSFEGRRLFVYSRIDSYFPAIRDALQQGKKWLHFNIDWEDEYVKRHLKLFARK